MNNTLNEAKSNLTFDSMVGMAKGTMNVATGAKKSGSKDEYSYSSLASAASKMVAVFPVLTSRTVSAETAQMVSKYIEQKMCSLFVLALQQANISTARNGIEYLRQYHQNLDTDNDDLGALIKVMDTWIGAYQAGVAESASISGYLATNDDIDFDSIIESDRDLEISAKDVAAIMKIMQENSMIEVMDTKLNPVSINDFIVNEMANGDYHVSIKSYDVLNESKRKKNRNNQDSAQDDADEAVRQGNAANARRWRDAQRTNDINLSQEEKEKREKEHEKDRRTAKWDRQRRIAREKKSDKEHDQRVKDEENARRTSGNNVSLKDMDVKKMNDAVPSMLVVRFYSMQTDEDGNVTHQSTVPTEFVIGVKSKLIPVMTDEILRRIMNDNKDGKKFTKFMRLMTGELSLGEVLFGLSRVRDDVKSVRKKGAYGSIWNLLQNRALASSEAVKHGVHNDYSAISTVVISQNDVDNLFHEENFDISDPKNALHFMKSYNLISFIIADDATEVVKILMDDNSKEFEEYAYRMFERETKDGTYKKLINLMAASK